MYLRGEEVIAPVTPVVMGDGPASSGEQRAPVALPPLQ